MLFLTGGLFLPHVGGPALAVFVCCTLHTRGAYSTGAFYTLCQIIAKCAPLHAKMTQHDFCTMVRRKVEEEKKEAVIVTGAEMFVVLFFPTVNILLPTVSSLRRECSVWNCWPPPSTPNKKSNPAPSGQQICEWDHHRRADAASCVTDWCRADKGMIFPSQVFLMIPPDLTRRTNVELLPF